MKVFTDPACLLHNPPHEILSGKITPYFESPSRITNILQVLRARGTFEIVSASTGLAADESKDQNADGGNSWNADPLGYLQLVHNKDYLEYIETAYERWCQDGGERSGVFPEAFPHSKLTVMGKTDPPSSVIAKAGYYCFDLSTPITADTFPAALASTRTTLTAAKALVDDCVDSESSNDGFATFALTRPPGHHAGSSVCGGYCFFNNVAAAARCLQGESLSGEQVEWNILILDIDYHHGNGTQENFYDDSSVMYVSLHAENDYPYFTGSASETGDDNGEGFNVNIPLPKGTGDDEYCAALEGVKALVDERDFRPDYLIVSLGVDTFKDDPICQFKITTPCYRRIGSIIRKLELPTLFVMEGGYHLDTLGDNVANVLQGFEEGLQGDPGGDERIAKRAKYE